MAVQAVRAAFLALACLILSGCPLLQRPYQAVANGIILDAETGNPVANAEVFFVMATKWECYEIGEKILDKYSSLIRDPKERTKYSWGATMTNEHGYFEKTWIEYPNSHDSLQRIKCPFLVSRNYENYPSECIFVPFGGSGKHNGIRFYYLKRICSASGEGRSLGPDDDFGSPACALKSVRRPR
ncbi:MAG: hypothetical protein N3A38_14225 [Planctomycetota bacterium]|nr:hypothetical protein [Planctomycetota bacterium]